MIRFENVGLRYGLGAEVLRDVTFGIEGRSFQFLTGPSGAGKTSLLRMMFLSLRPTRGLISVFDHDAATLSKDGRATLRRRIGIVFQDFRLLDHMTTYENVALPLRVLGKEEVQYRPEVVELLQWVGLGECMDALPPVLSGGEKQRTAIAAPAAPVHRAQQIGHGGGDRHPRHRLDGRIRRAPAGAARRPPACL